MWCVLRSHLSECRKAHVLQQTWPLHSDVASRVLGAGTRTGSGWQDASLSSTQICAERSLQEQHARHSFWGSPHAAITPFAPKRSKGSAALLFHTRPARMGMLETFILPDWGITSFIRIRHISVNKIQEESELQWAIYREQKKILFTTRSDKAPGRGSNWAADSLFVAPQQQFSSAPLHSLQRSLSGSCCRIWLLPREERGRQETTAKFPTDPRQFIIACW